MSQTTLTATIWREHSMYVSLYPELGVSSCGDSPEEAVEMLREAVELYLEDAAEFGSLPDLLPMIESPVRFSTPLTVALP